MSFNKKHRIKLCAYKKNTMFVMRLFAITTLNLLYNEAVNFNFHGCAFKVGMLATASWAGSEVEPPVEVKPDLLIVVDGGNVSYLDDGSPNCIQVIVMSSNPNVNEPIFNQSTCE